MSDRAIRGIGTLLGRSEQNRFQRTSVVIWAVFAIGSALSIGLALWSLHDEEIRDAKQFTYVAALGWLAAVSSVGALLYWLQRIRRREQESQAKAEQEIRGAETRYRMLFDANPFPMYVIDRETLKLLAVNEAIVMRYGWSREELLAMTIADIRPSEDVPRMLIDMQEHRSEQPRVAQAWRHRTRDGTVLDVEISTRAIDFGGRRAVLAMAHDVTERKRMMDALWASEGRLRRTEGRLQAILDNAPALISAKDLSGRTILVNRRFEMLNGPPPQEWIGKSVFDLFPASVADALWANDRAALSSNGPIEAEETVAHKDGTEHTYFTVKFPMQDESGAPSSVGAISIDITERKRAEQVLREIESWSRVLMDNSPMSIALKDLDGRYLFVNKVFLERNGGVSLEDILGKMTAELFPAHLTERIRAHEREVMASGRPSMRADYVAFHDGSMHHIEDIKFLVPGPVPAIGTISIDVTERRRVSLALQEAEARLRAMMDNSPLAVTLKDIDGHYIFVNKRFEEWFGRRLEDVAGKTVTEAFPHRRSEQTLAQERELIASGQQSRQVSEFAFHDRSIHHLDIVKFLVPGPVPAIGSIATDVTAQRQVEEQLRQAQKMEAVGQLTGGIAHDFNNLLTVVLGNAEILAAALRGDPKLDRLAGMISAAALRGADLTNRLLAFARKQTLQPKVTDINDLLKRSGGLLRRALGEHIEIKLVYGSGLKPLIVDPAQLEAAILNLAVNARDAMPGGGKLTIETANAELDQAYARANEGVLPGPYVKISVTDTGSGMAPEILAKAFDPFFTTKEVGKGTGLGLSMVYGFVKQSGGHLKIYSEVGHGTTINLYLPQAGKADESMAAAAELTVPAEVVGGGETILMVEDDAMVRTYVESQLAGLGYRVLVASNGPEALETLRRVGSVDLLFTDIVMPRGMTGLQLAAEALRLRPALKVLYTSGYAEMAIDNLGSLGQLGDGTNLLSKPYRRHDLAAKLRKIFDR